MRGVSLHEFAHVMLMVTHPGCEVCAACIALVELFFAVRADDLGVYSGEKF